MATRKLIVYPNKDLMIQAGAQRFCLGATRFARRTIA